jgi:hypothetical protein
MYYVEIRLFDSKANVFLIHILHLLEKEIVISFKIEEDFQTQEITPLS